MSGLTDEQLLVRYRQGHTPAFAALIERYKQDLFHFLYRFVGDRQAAEDLFQETFLQIHLSAHTFDRKRQLKPWIFTIGANKARDYLRKNARQPTVAFNAPMKSSNEGGREFLDLMEAKLILPADEIARQETAELVQEVLASLPGHMREVLLLAYFHRFAYKDIAEMLEVPLGTIKSRLHAAVVLFGEQWKRKYGDSGQEDLGA
jgi:RNA polymerase sigma-70 factor (ECF subfamily)